jgi:hypothetical protein
MSGSRKTETAEQETSLLEKFKDITSTAEACVDDRYIVFYKDLYQDEKFKPLWKELYAILVKQRSTETLDFFVEYLKLTQTENVAKSAWKEFYYKWVDEKGKGDPRFFSHQKVNLIFVTQKRLADLNKAIEKNEMSEIDLSKIQIDIKSNFGEDETLSGKKIIENAVTELLIFLNVEATGVLYRADQRESTKEKGLKGEKKEKKPEEKEKKDKKELKEEKKREKEEKEKAKKEAKLEKQKEKKEKKEEGRRLKL